MAAKRLTSADAHCEGIQDQSDLLKEIGDEEETLETSQRDHRSCGQHRRGCH